MKINDVCGFSHLHKAVIRVETSRVAWSPGGVDASVPAVVKVFVTCQMLANGVCEF